MDRQITIEGQAVVLAIGMLDGVGGIGEEVYRYTVVTQDLKTGDCRMGSVRHLEDAEVLVDTRETFKADRWPTGTRERAVGAALRDAGYDPLRFTEDL